MDISNIEQNSKIIKENLSTKNKNYDMKLSGEADV
jgi:hypothetical protein